MKDTRIGQVWMTLSNGNVFVVYNHELCHFMEEDVVVDFAIRKCLDLADVSKTTLLFEFEDMIWESDENGMRRLV